MSEKVDLKVICDSLAHANISTTSFCLHTQDDARYGAAMAAHRIGWHSARCLV